MWVFALAFATCLVNGIAPEKQQFDQEGMRKHLYQCLEKGELTMFPIKKGRLPKKGLRTVKTQYLSSVTAECPKMTVWYNVVNVTNGSAMCRYATSSFGRQ